MCVFNWKTKQSICTKKYVLYILYSSILLQFRGKTYWRSHGMTEKIPYTIGTSSRSCSTTIILRHPNQWGILFVFFYWQKKKLKKMLQILSTYLNIKSRYTVQYKKKSWSTVFSNIHVLKNLSFFSQSSNIIIPFSNKLAKESCPCLRVFFG